MSEVAVESPRDPWDRFGWIMGTVWLAFLGFPLASAVAADRHWALRALTVALIAAFAALYVHGLVRLGRAATWADVVHWGR